MYSVKHPKLTPQQFDSNKCNCNRPFTYLTVIPRSCESYRMKQCYTAEHYEKYTCISDEMSFICTVLYTSEKSVDYQLIQGKLDIHSTPITARIPTQTSSVRFPSEFELPGLYCSIIFPCYFLCRS